MKKLTFQSNLNKICNNNFCLPFEILKTGGTVNSANSADIQPTFDSSNNGTAYLKSSLIDMWSTITSRDKVGVCYKYRICHQTILKAEGQHLLPYSKRSRLHKKMKMLLLNGLLSIEVLRNLLDKG